MRDPIYTDRSLLNAQTGANPNNVAIKSQTLPRGGVMLPHALADETYCTCTQGQFQGQGASTLYRRHPSTSASRRQTSFVTFKPIDCDARDVSGGPDATTAADEHVNADTQSLDLIRESESQNLENMHRASMTPNLSSGRHTRCARCSIPVTICSCGPSNMTSSTLSQLPPRKPQRDPTMVNNLSV